MGNTYRAGQVGECQDTNRGRRSPAVQRAGCRAARRVCPRDRFCDAPRASPRSRCQMNRMHCGRREKAAEWVSVEGGRVVSCCHGDALFHEKRDTEKPKKRRNGTRHPPARIRFIGHPFPEARFCVGTRCGRLARAVGVVRRPLRGKYAIAVRRVFKCGGRPA